MGPKYSSSLLDGQPIVAFVDGMSLDPRRRPRRGPARPAAVMYSNYLAMDFAGNQTPLAGITNFVLRDRVDSPLTRIQVGAGSWSTVDAQAYHQARAGELHYCWAGAGSGRTTRTTARRAPAGILDDLEYTKVRLTARARSPSGGT